MFHGSKPLLYIDLQAWACFWLQESGFLTLV